MAASTAPPDDTRPPGAETLAGRLLTPDGFRPGRLRFGRRIVAVESVPASEAAVADHWVLPGFVDAHVHGGGGGDTMEGEEALRVAARFHARHGTTTLVPTTWTAPFAALERGLAAVRGLIERPEPEAASVAGAHLEGPWVSPVRLGAQPPHARTPERWEVDRLLEMTTVRTVTLAPEIAGGLELVERLTAAGVRVQIGHSDADAATVRAALDRGAAGFTHLFNAMSGFHHRRPGVAGAALASGRAAELIVDGAHLAPEAIALARRALPDWYCVSDAIGAAGLADGEYRLGEHPVTLRGGTCRLTDGTLAGSTCTLLDSLRLLVQSGLELAEAARRVASVPAAELGLEDRGRIEVGARADLVVLDDRLRLLEVRIEGRRIPLKGESG